ncbi:MAG: hypothetical protein N2578_06305 [Bdellovibrionaceae bacterium]|nr:hypothetical protein [Pseudobdellovibrionaceae bacterium]
MRFLFFLILFLCTVAGAQNPDQGSAPVWNVRLNPLSLFSQTLNLVIDRSLGENWVLGVGVISGANTLNDMTVKTQGLGLVGRYYFEGAIASSTLGKIELRDGGGNVLKSASYSVASVGFFINVGFHF